MTPADVISHDVIAHWDEVDADHRAQGHIAASWQSLTGDRSVTAGVRRIVIDPGQWSTPLHLENSEEEIFYVLGGSGVSLQWEWGGKTEAFAVGEGDCLVHIASQHGHTLQAGPDGLDVLAFGERHYPLGSTYLPRAGVSWGLGAWARAGDPEDHPWRREAAAGTPDVPELSVRPARIVNVGAIEAEPFGNGGTVRSSWRDLASAAGSIRSGLNQVEVEPGALSTPPHCHSADEEIFVVLSGDGELDLWPSRRFGGELQTHPVRAGCTVARPAGTHLAHTFRGGPAGMTLLAYGTRAPNDICFYPRSGKVSFRGVGVIGRLEQLDYWEGED